MPVPTSPVPTSPVPTPPMPTSPVPLTCAHLTRAHLTRAHTPHAHLTCAPHLPAVPPSQAAGGVPGPTIPQPLWLEEGGEQQHPLGQVVFAHLRHRRPP
ncbi:hypothetical protein P7K49_013201 [Saguinus oedipus]|uniref:Uncharacterized protein n=1 Tax=Saguinus oedipus TaxID=9490 RepID=A0ABQ9VFT5_SAGOE|nr:hypothetical protein P7K49_013201 [Saguinus oedipus]